MDEVHIGALPSHFDDLLICAEILKIFQMQLYKRLVAKASAIMPLRLVFLSNLTLLESILENPFLRVT